MSDEHAHEHGHDHDADATEGLELELDAQGQIFLEMRGQNLELLKIAAQVAGFAGSHAPLKPHDLKQAMRSIWEVYSEFYSWVDPEESEDEEDDEE